MRILLMGDIHYYRLWTSPLSLFGKRLIGHGNLLLHRRHHFDRSLLPPTVEHAHSLKPDMVLMSGDLTTTALAREFIAVAKVLRPLTQATPTVLVPGNHDRYSFESARLRRMEQAFGTHVPDEFPHVRHLCHRWQLLALDSSVPRLTSSRGRIGSTQLADCKSLLTSLNRNDGLIVLTHYAMSNHPDNPVMKHHHQLEDERELRDMLRNCAARILFMHGHIHQPWVFQRKDDGMTHVTDINAGAPVMHSGKYPHGQGFWLFELPEQADGPVHFDHYFMEERPTLGMGEAAWKVVRTTMPVGASSD